ncbi:Mur ligase family protein [Selenihalanaerobacter shriftii]|uniref:UDP-N-acetylmuramoylalanyl-D-glutamate--2,6-diaminopimelate ligase n=1 Tax=Selenihalanaerobacter shriftii TaxID=142842 RepID=A0A1T4LGK5_9FIRM|nr:UDP-N-acetylmuramyl-tripeptide synthetase [Selenihalanaerobacter shriftii]SJZ53889.1 UDP-N-acetylmuramoylalanyl-D-glutamate--2,6-diaminopimelate ligase [Selenihalanaerobacter shriftii]
MKICDYNISGVTCDSREVKPGYAFVAIEGFKDDGNKYIENAIERGAKVIYTEQDIKDTNVPVVKVANARETLARLAHEFYDMPSNKLNLIGVTGTNGKTTTTHLIESLFANNDFETGLLGTVKTKIGDRIEEAKLTTPDAVMIHKYLREMVDRNVNIASMEVSSHGIKLNRIDGLDFDIVVHTNVTRDHLDLHNDFEDYLLTKKRLFQQCSEEKFALINIDDEYSEDIRREIPPYVITYGFSQESDVRAINLKYDNTGSHFTVVVQQELTTISGNKIQPQRFKIRLGLLGKHNVYNGLATIIIGLLYDLDIENIQEGLSKFKPFFRRLEVIYNKEFTVIDDCAHNPGNYQAVFNTIKDLDYNNLYIINSIRGNRGLTVNKENAEIISKHIPGLNVTELYITSCEKLVNQYDIVSSQERDLFISTLQNNNIDLRYFNRLKPCLYETVNKVDNGDLIVLLGAHAMDTASEITLNMISQID